MSWLGSQMDNNKKGNITVHSLLQQEFFLIIVFVHFLLCFGPFHFTTSIILVNLIYLHINLEAFLHCSLR